MMFISVTRPNSEKLLVSLFRLDMIESLPQGGCRIYVGGIYHEVIEDLDTITANIKEATARDD